jgi:Xaa-Pro dipeptidase
MSSVNADALLICAGSSLAYFTGIAWALSERLVAMVLPRSGTPVIVCPTFETGSLAAELKIDLEIRLWEEHESPSELATGVLREFGVNNVAVDSALPYGMAERLRIAAPSTSLIDAAPIIDGCRMCKSPTELALMRQAKQMTLEVQRRAARILAPGIKASAVCKFIDDAHRIIGGGGSSFCIVQFGASTAYPHGLPGDDILAEGDMVLIDTGCAVKGYHSDITRSYVFGEPTREQSFIWQLEQEAQQSAFEAALPGRSCESVDAAARTVLERAGLGPGYKVPGLPHRTGHGIGLSIHEPPYLVRGDHTELQPGMCFSDEPTIVIPGKFGVRLEDHFYITGKGAEWFTGRSISIDSPFA